ncbi:MAG: DUF4197 domain-containing protein [Flavobacteriales bacterium]|nr:DUF4197 domain-containing protein [Flavobacteriales bacterium]
MSNQNMKNTFILLLTLLATNGSAQFPKSLKDAASKVMPAAGGLSNDDVIAGLKEALTKGAGNSVSLASVADGFNKNARIRIPFPPEAEKMKSTLSTIGMNKQVEEFELTLNRAAEEAVKQAVPIFSDAVKGMSIGDGFAILKGKDDAATGYLKDKTTTSLTNTFRPIVEAATKKVALTNYWTPLANGYNKASTFTGGKAVNPDLDAYVTERAIAGLFILLADEEMKIRKDPMARTSDLLKRVFGGK